MKNQEILEKIDDHFTGFNSNSKVWVFLANHTLLPHLNSLDKDLTLFMQNWKAHGVALNAKHIILENRILVVAVDNNKEQASGCSIDGFVHYIDVLKDKYKVDFLNRNLQLLLVDNELILLPLEDVKTHIANGKINRKDLVFVNSVDKLAMLPKRWIQPIGNSWLAKYFSS